MCEDRGLQIRRSTTNRVERVQQVRQRFRAIRRTLPTDPIQCTQNAPTPVEQFATEMHRDHIPMPMEAATADVNVNMRRLQRFNMHNNPDVRLIPNYRVPRGNLVEIAMRTVMLMRQNQQLQHKLAALRAETKMFMQAVISNQENQVALQNQGNRNPEVKVEENLPMNLALDVKKED